MPPRADDADDGRSTYVELEGVEREGHVVGQHLRQNRTSAPSAFELAPPASTASMGPVSTLSTVSDRSLADDADVEEDQGQDAGEGADTDGGDEDERVEQVGDGADHAEDAARERQA